MGDDPLATIRMGLSQEYVASERDELVRRGVRVIGELDRLSLRARDAVADLTAATARSERLTATLCISYSSRTEIAGAARPLAQEVLAGRLTPGEIDEHARGGSVRSRRDGK